MEKTTQKAVERVTTTVLKLTSLDIIDALRRRDGKLFKDADTSVQVKVPSGGDYSGMTLDVDNDMPLVVTIRQTTRREAK